MRVKSEFRALRLGNFKAFGDAQRIPLKPLTLVYGPNGAGKSSFLHGLAFIHEVELGRTTRQRSMFDVYRTDIGGEAISLGGFRQMLHRSDPRRSMTIGMELLVSSFPKDLHVARLLSGFRSVELRYTIAYPPPDPSGGFWGPGEKYLAGDAPSITRVEVFVDNDLAITILSEASWAMGWAEDIEDYDIIRRVLRKVDVNVDNKVFDFLLSELESYVLASARLSGSKASVEARRILRELSKGLAIETDGFLDFHVSMVDPAGRKVSPVLLLPHFEDRTAHEDSRIHRLTMLFFSELLSGLGDVARSGVERLEYLGPLRSIPPRFFSPLENECADSWATGASAWEMLRRSDTARDQVNRWLGAEFLKTSYVLGLQRFIDIEELRGVLSDALEWFKIDPEGLKIFRGKGQWERSPSVADPDGQVAEFITNLERHWSEMFWSQRMDQLTLVDQRTNSKVTHRDVGTGVSQILPILVAASGAHDSLIAIEQPEIHLHPAMQAELGDIFIESMHNNKNAFLLETHSEHLMLRVQRRIRDGVLSKDDVCVLYVSPGPDGSRFMELRLDDEGDFVDEWPGGFFEESFRERFSRR